MFGELFRLLVLPLTPHCLDVKSTNLGLFHNALCLSDNRHINHLPIQRPRTSSLLVRLLIPDDNPNRPLHLFLTRRENLLRHLHLRWMDALLPVETQPLAALALLAQRPPPLVAAERRTHQVDGRGQIVRARRGDDCAAGVEELGQRGRAGQREVEREIFRGEDEAGEVWRRRADFRERGEGARGFDEREQADRRSV